VFDFGANALLWWLHRKAVALDVNKWPVGGARLETIGNIAYGAFVMTSPSAATNSNLRLLVRVFNTLRCCTSSWLMTP